MSEELEITQELKHVNVLSLQPGDVIVIRIPHRLPAETEERILEMSRVTFPGHECVLLSDGADIAVARPAK